MRRYLALVSSLLTGLAVMAIVAFAAAPGVINSYVGVCNTDFATQCIKPNSDGSINVNTSGGGGTVATNITQTKGVTLPGNGVPVTDTTGADLANATQQSSIVTQTTATAAAAGTPNDAACTANPCTIDGAVRQLHTDIAGATGIGCDSHAIYDASDTGSITLVTGQANKKIYICGDLLATGSTATNLKLVEGSNANCAAGAANVTPAYQLVANQSTGFMSPIWNGMVTATNGDYLCINASAANSHQAEVWYHIQ